MNSTKIQKLNWITCCIYFILGLRVLSSKTAAGAELISYIYGCFWLHLPTILAPFMPLFNELNPNSKFKLNNMLHSFYFRSTSNAFCQVKQLPELNWFPMWLLLAASLWQSLQSSSEQSPNPLVILSPFMNSISRLSI